MLSREEIAKRCLLAMERGKKAKPKFDEKKLRDWFAWEKMKALIGKERPNDL